MARALTIRRGLAGTRGAPARPAASPDRPGTPARVFTVAGWSPSLRTLLRGRILPCGCLTGLYERWDGTVEEVVDAPFSGCSDRRHRLDASLTGPG